MSETTTEPKVTKMSLIRDALQVLGPDAKPVAIALHLKAKHGLEVSAGMCSTYKSVIQKGGKLSHGTTSRKAKMVRVNLRIPRANGNGHQRHKFDVAPPFSGKRRGADAAGITIDDIATVKSLCRKIGADKVGQLAAALG